MSSPAALREWRSGISKIPAPPIEATGGTEATHFVEIGKIGPYQRTKAAGDIGERRRFLARQYHCNDSRYHDGHEYRHSNAKAGNEIGYPMNHKGDNGRRHQSFRPQLAFDEQIKRYQCRNDRAANIDRKHGAFPMANARHRITHAEEIDGMMGRDPFRRQFRDWDVENAADQRGKEQENRCVGTGAEPLISIAHRSLDPGADIEPRLC